MGCKKSEFSVTDAMKKILKRLFNGKKLIKKFLVRMGM
jgi:hypothetical protein